MRAILQNLLIVRGGSVLIARTRGRCVVERGPASQLPLKREVQLSERNRDAGVKAGSIGEGEIPPQQPLLEVHHDAEGIVALCRGVRGCEQDSERGHVWCQAKHQGCVLRSCCTTGSLFSN